MSTATKTETLEMVLSSVTGRLFVGFGDMHEFITRVAGWDVFNHQLPRVNEEQVKPWILRNYPEVGTDEVQLICNEVGDDLSGLDHAEAAVKIKAMVEVLCEQYGLKPRYEVPPMPLDNRVTRDPIEELVAMIGPNKPILTVGENGVEVFQDGGAQ